jgi:hypothetical protein
LIIGKKVNKHHHQQTAGSNNLSVTLRPFPSSVFCCGQIGKHAARALPINNKSSAYLLSYDVLANIAVHLVILFR